MTVETRYPTNDKVAPAYDEADHSPRRVIAAASLGTVFEWYDFTLYGALATVIAGRFFAGVDETTGFIFALLTFAVGFIMRPFGAILFGRIGDQIGRKQTFIVTIIVMGLATVAVGLLPTYESIGIIAPIALVGLRMLQGLALGGEYGGAATYVAEHSPAGRRGFSTSWISSTGTLGLLLAFGVILITRWLTAGNFDTWGWRIPFVFSLVLLAISLVIRLNMHESPAFQKLKNEKKLSKAPLSETFLDGKNIKRLLVAFFAICGGMTCCYYTAVLFPTFFLTQTLKVDAQEANEIVTLATFVCVPFFALSGWLCDRFGRKPILLGGYLLMIVGLFPIFHAMTQYANPALAEAQQATPVSVVADTSQCSFMFNPVGSRRFTTPCDIAKQALSAAGVSYSITSGNPGQVAVINIGGTTVSAFDAASLPPEAAKARDAEFRKDLRAALDAVGYPEKADPAQVNKPMIFLLLLGLLFIMTLTLVPTAPALVELFPTRIRYTSMSFPYHFASGWVGGLLPTLSFAISTQMGNIYSGLWYPLGWVVTAFVVALVFLPETKDRDLDKEY